MVPEIEIRPLEPADVDTVVGIAVAAWQPVFAGYRQMMGDELFVTVHPHWQREKARQVRQACLPDSSALIAVAEVPQDGEQAAQVVGFVTCYSHPTLGVGEIGNNAVRPDWQGQGIAPCLYQYAFAWLRERGMRYVKVHTGGDPAHAPARRAYQKAGFDVALPQVEYYRQL